MDDVELRTVPQLLSNLVRELSELIERETELLRAEMAEKFAQSGRAAAAMAVGAVLLLGGFMALLATIVLALTLVVAPLWACLITAGVFGAAGLATIRAAVSRLQSTDITPERSLRQAERLAAVAKGQRQ